MPTIVIQIPCHNEEQTLGATLAELPRRLPGVECILWLVVDDGSTDATAEVASRAGVDRIVRLAARSGAARAFEAGIAASLEMGADIVVQTDGDNQYRAEGIAALIRPILAGEASFVIGIRPIDRIRGFSPLKKFLLRLGSKVVSLAAGVDVADAVSGFRAMDRATAERLRVHGHYTYTAETIIQAGRQGIAVASVPIERNEDLRPSRLVRNIPTYVARQAWIILRTMLRYTPYRIPLLAAAGSFVAGAVLEAFGWPETGLPAGFFGLGAILAGLTVLLDLRSARRAARRAV